MYALTQETRITITILLLNKIDPRGAFACIARVLHFLPTFHNLFLFPAMGTSTMYESTFHNIASVFPQNEMKQSHSPLP